MIFEEIVLENFGVFRGRQALDLAPKSSDRPIILVGGLNGGGKTTLLDALQLVLYGRLARCSNRGSLAYDEFIRRCVHRGIQVGDPVALELRFRRLMQGEEQRYSVRRWWDFAAESPIEHIRVSVNGVPDAVLTETWPEQVEAILPQGLSALFFFDGEKIEELAAPHSSAAVLSTAISSLLGLEVVDRLSTDLSALNRRKLVESGSETEKAEIQAAEVEVRTLERMIEETERERAAGQNEFDRALHELKVAEEGHAREGGALLSRQQPIAVELASARARWDETRAEFWHQAAGAAPLALVQDQLQSILAQATREHEHTEALSLLKTLEIRDAHILSRFQKVLKTPSASKWLESLMTEDRAKRKPRGGLKPYLGLDENGRAQIAQLLETILPGVKKRTRELEGEIGKSGESIANLERKQAAIPEKETMSTTSRLVKERQIALDRASASMSALDSKLGQLRRDLELKQSGLIRVLERDVGEKLKQADDQRLLAHAARVRKTLTIFREAIVRRHVSKIEHLVLECFQQLLHKTSLVSEIRIDPQTYALTLYGGDRQLLLQERLSAGERQLLAVALLWGLARAAGRALPTIIDTPLGRLDAAHRRHLIDRYFPLASHQVVLLATDSEINEEYHRSLSKSVSREYTLTHDSEHRCIQVKPGFFDS